jgi:hypothetical protein
VLALTLDEAKNIAIIAAAVLLLGAVLSFWVMKSIISKVIVAGLLGLLAFAVWTQRTSLQDCADKVQGNFERVGTEVTVADTDCSFFGVTVTISDPRGDPEPSGDSTDDG